VSTFVTVGNSLDPFPRLLDAVARLATAGKLPQPVVVQYGNNNFQSPGCDSRAFIDRESFQDLIRDSELVITHGGMTVMHALHHGKIPVVMPRRAHFGEVSDDHQVEFSTPRAEAGDIVMVEHPARLEQAIQRALAMQANSANVRRAAIEPPLVGEIRNLLQRIQQQREQPSRARN
jgi:UDP-N-acetylglucosamine transferase subunit ALG13